MIRPAHAEKLHQIVRELVRCEPELLGNPIGPSSQSEELGYEIRSKLVYDDEGVLSILLRGVVALAMDVLAGYGEIRERREDVPSNGLEYIGIVAPDVEHLLLARYGKGIQPDREDGQFPGAPGGLVQSPSIGIESGGLMRVHLAYALRVFVVGRELIWKLDVITTVLPTFERADHHLRRVAQFDAELVHQFEIAVLIYLGEQRQLGVGGAPLHECATRVVAYATDDGCADA